MGFGPIIISGDNSGTAEAELREGLNKGCWSGCWGCSGSHHGGSKSVVHSSPSSFKAFLMWSSPPATHSRSIPRGQFYTLSLGQKVSYPGVRLLFEYVSCVLVSETCCRAGRFLLGGLGSGRFLLSG